MATVNALIAYSSADASTEQLVRVARRAGAEVRLRRVEEFADAGRGAWADVAWADVVLWGAPSRHDNVATQLRHIFDRLAPRWVRGALDAKVYGGFTASRLDDDDRLLWDELKAFERMAERCVSIAQRQKAA